VEFTLGCFLLSVYRVDSELVFSCRRLERTYYVREIVGFDSRGVVNYFFGKELIGADDDRSAIASAKLHAYQLIYDHSLERLRYELYESYVLYLEDDPVPVVVKESLLDFDDIEVKYSRYSKSHLNRISRK